MQDYFETTYKFLDMSPHVLIPMHGRINLWPKHMLCGYLRYEKLITSPGFIRILQVLLLKLFLIFFVRFKGSLFMYPAFE
jgi:hypothetical protein